MRKPCFIGGEALACFLLSGSLFSSCAPLTGSGGPVERPADFEVRWGSGGVHAEWGRKEGTLNAKGELVWVESRGYGDEAYRNERRGQASREQLDALWRAIQENRFFKLRESYDNPMVRDGFSSFIVVRAAGRQHMVAVANTRQARFSRVNSVLDELVRSAIPEERENEAGHEDRR